MIPKKIKEIERGCGAWSQGIIKGVTFQTQCGNDGFKDKICLCDVCRTKLQLLKELSLEIEKVIDELRMSENSRLLHNLDGVETDFLLSANELKQKLLGDGK